MSPEPSMVNQFDVVIASLPFVETDEPMMAPALLKGVVDRVGMTSYTFDFNAEVTHYIDQNLSRISEKITRWFLYQENEDCAETLSAIDQIVEYVKTRILEKNSTWICLSLFCHTAKKFNIKLCTALRKSAPDKKIVIGGNAVFTDESSKRPYAAILKKIKLIDHFVVGDGEEPLYNLLTVNTQGVDTNSFQELDDLTKQPFSNFDDYNWDLYETKRIPMYGSRGCVRRCTFCDVYKIWKKFKLRPAEDVFSEMVYQFNKTGISEFYFRDSLINGSVSEFRNLMTLIAEYNRTAVQKFRWTSFFIFRPKEAMPEQDWILTAQSGATNLVVGVESLVDSIRYHMRKKFTNADIDFSLEMAQKYGVGLTFLLIMGYVNETEDDFNESLQWLESHQQYAGFPIRSMAVGGSLVVTDLTDLYLKADEYNITIGDKIHLWTNESINLDYETRMKRKQIFAEKAISLGYPLTEFEQPVA